MTTKIVRRILVAGAAAAATLTLAAAPAGASEPLSSTGSEQGVATGGVQNGTAVGSSAYTFTVQKATCVGRSNEQVTIKQVEHGQSGTTRFKQGYEAQFLTNGGWRTFGTRIYTSNSFPNNSKSFFFTQGVKYTYGNTAPASHRIVWAGQWLGAGGQVIAHAARTFTCP